jgi:small redox-active disulfide protein 2
MEIKVLGSGCIHCEKVEKLLRETVAETGVTATIEKVTDAMKIVRYGVLVTPAVVVNGKVKSVGKVPMKKDILSWLSEGDI